MKIVILYFLSISLFFMGCTEDRILRQALKPSDQVIPKSMVDQKALFLYAPTNLETSRTSKFGQAYQLGTSEVVKFEINEFSLDVVAVERDPRFADNDANNKVILSIPIEHVDYRCQDDAYGECIGNEVEDDRIAFHEKKYIKPDFSSITNIETQFFEYEFEGPDECYSLQSTEVENRSFSKDHINFTLNRHYKDSLYFFCLMGTDTSNWNNLNWSAKTAYSFVRLEDAITQDYKPIPYHVDWEGTFGFFETLDYKLDLDGNRTQELENKYIQRWNPNRKEIVYNLSDSFNKEENKSLKSATYEAFDRINDGLKEAGVKFRVKVKDFDPAVEPHDLRNTMLVLVDDPLDSGIIGYGPSTANPLTGEVISAKTIMYGGSIRRFVKYSYDEIVFNLAKKNAEVSANHGPSESQITLEQLSQQIQAQSIPLHQGASEIANQAMAKDLSESRPTQWVRDIIHVEDRTPQFSKKDLEQFVRHNRDHDYIVRLAKQNRYPSELLAFGDLSQDLLETLVSEVGELKRWADLNQKQRQTILDIMMPFAWIPTLVHEVGHNLGLRHNFSGSEDEENYYTHEELVDRDLPSSGDLVPYSSVMDYSKSEANSLRGFGKYDIAALRFGYTQKVEDTEGQLVAVNSAEAMGDDLFQSMKAYQYCTDEGVAPNATCNAFDEGSGYKAIAESIIDSYKQRYFTRNLRNGRADFSTFSEHSYMFGIRRTMESLRRFFDTFESITVENQMTDEDVQEIPWLKELNDTVTMISQFYLEVIGTPDTTCLISEKASGALSILPIEFFSPFSRNFSKDCQQLELIEEFEVIGEAGRPINSFKLSSNPNAFADQIDVQGVWVDKLVALEMLFKRSLGSSIQDEYQGNFFDHSGSVSTIIAFFEGLTSNQLVVPTEVRLFGSGERLTVPLRMDLMGDHYEIHRGDIGLVNFYLDTPFENAHLPELFTMKMVQGIWEGSESDSQNLLKTAFRLHSSEKTPTGPNFITTELDGDSIFANEDSFMSRILIQNKARAQFYESQNLDVATLESILNTRLQVDAILSGETLGGAFSLTQNSEIDPIGSIDDLKDPFVFEDGNGNDDQGDVSGDANNEAARNEGLKIFLNWLGLSYHQSIELFSIEEVLIFRTS